MIDDYYRVNYVVEDIASYGDRTEQILAKLEKWIAQEEANIAYAKSRIDKAGELIAAVYILNAQAQMRVCPLCFTESLDTTPLKEVVDHLAPYYEDGMPILNYSSSLSGWFCPNCKLWESNLPPTPRAFTWTHRDLKAKPKSHGFAAEIFQHFPYVQMVALESLASGPRLWSFLIDNIWYSNSLKKEELEERLGFKGPKHNKNKETA